MGTVIELPVKPQGPKATVEWFDADGCSLAAYGRVTIGIFDRTNDTSSDLPPETHRYQVVTAGKMAPREQIKQTIWAATLDEAKESAVRDAVWMEAFIAKTGGGAE